MAMLREAARLLRHDGRMILIEWRHDSDCPSAPPAHRRIGFPEMVKLLEQNTWDVHRHGHASAHSYYLEGAVSDESVQS